MRAVWLLLQASASEWKNRRNIMFCVVLILGMISIVCCVREQGIRTSESGKIALGVAKEDTSEYANLLMKYFNENKVLEALSPDKDVDGLHPKNLGDLFLTDADLKPCTPLACMELIRSVCPVIEGKTALIIGRSRLVGKPLAQMLLKENATVIQAHSKTTNLKELCSLSDILIAATGKTNLINPSFVKKGAVVIDVGITRLDNNKITGDLDFEEIKKIAGFITPVPGGVGPMTVTMLFVNLLIAYKKNLAKSPK